MANRDAGGYLKSSTGVVLDGDGTAFTADFETQAYNPSGDWLGLWWSNVNTGGSSATLDVTLECSPDGGTTWVAYPADKNSQTGAAMAQVTSLDDSTKNAGAPEFYIQPFPHGGQWTWRAKFNYGGTIGSNVVTAQFFTRGTASEQR
jgi:hypothetical protein